MVNMPMVRFLRALVLGSVVAAFLSPAFLRAQFKFSPEDSTKLAKRAIIEADSIKKAEEAKKNTPAHKAGADSVAVPKPPAPPASTAKTVTRQTAPHAKKNMPRVKDSTATRR